MISATICVLLRRVWHLGNVFMYYLRSFLLQRYVFESHPPLSKRWLRSMQSSFDIVSMIAGLFLYMRGSDRNDQMETRISNRISWLYASSVKYFFDLSKFTVGLFCIIWKFIVSFYCFVGETYELFKDTKFQNSNFNHLLYYSTR